MAMRSRLGKGLGALFPPLPGEEDEELLAENFTADNDVSRETIEENTATNHVLSGRGAKKTKAKSVRSNISDELEGTNVSRETIDGPRGDGDRGGQPTASGSAGAARRSNEVEGIGAEPSSRQVKSGSKRGAGETQNSPKGRSSASKKRTKTDKTTVSRETIDQNLVGERAVRSESTKPSSNKSVRLSAVSEPEPEVDVSRETVDHDSVEKHAARSGSKKQSRINPIQVTVASEQEPEGDVSRETSRGLKTGSREASVDRPSTRASKSVKTGRSSDNTAGMSRNRSAVSAEVSQAAEEKSAGEIGIRNAGKEEVGIEKVGTKAGGTGTSGSKVNGSRTIDTKGNDSGAIGVGSVGVEEADTQEVRARKVAKGEVSTGKVGKEGIVTGEVGNEEVGAGEVGSTGISTGVINTEEDVTGGIDSQEVGTSDVSRETSKESARKRRQIPAIREMAHPSDVFFAGSPMPRTEQRSGMMTSRSSQSARKDRDEQQDNELKPVAGGYLAELRLDQIGPNAQQPRTIFDEDELRELAASIQEVGVLEPVVVRKRPSREVHKPIQLQNPVAILARLPRSRAISSSHNSANDDSGTEYELIMGERRWRAAQIAGLKTMPAIVKTTSDENMLRDALLENLHRVALNPLEEAAAYKQMMTDFGMTQEQLSQSVSKSRPQIANMLRLLNLPGSVQKKVAAGVLSAGHARALLGLTSADEMEKLANRIIAEGLSVRSTEEIVAMKMNGGIKPKKAAANKADFWNGSPVQQGLENRFDTKVSIKGNQKRGRIEIVFSSPEDMDRIIALLMPQKDEKRESGWV